jgi:glycosyltransferase involved in cell wall biosynthesis
VSSRPRVGIDAHHLAAIEGNRSYTVALLRALVRSGTTGRFGVVSYGPADLPDAAAALGDEGRSLEWGAPLPRGAVGRTLLAVPRVQRRDRLDLWHASFVAPPLAPAPTVLAVHDALALSRPDLFTRRFALRMKILLPRSIARARAVLVPTEAVRRSLEALGLGHGKTHVAPIGIDERVFSPEADPEDESVRRALGVGREPYVLAVGRADRRKRLPLLVAAFGRAARAGERLVLAGPLAREEALGRAPGVLIARSPDERALAALYRGARALAFPSAGEGLGLPIVEALACGTPVVASDLPVFREVTAGAALALVPEGELEAGLARALRAALDLSSSERARLALVGLERARRFSLGAMAAATEKAWTEALGRA